MPGIFAAVLDMPVQDQILVIILGGLGLFILRQVVVWSIGALASALVTAINGQLGLDAIRRDVTSMKRKIEDVPEMRTQIENLEGQLESIINEGGRNGTS